VNPGDKDVFVFLEIFAREGGIQSYVKDILKTYILLADREYQVRETSRQADVFLLRDRSGCANPFEGQSAIAFHYLYTQPPTLGRLRLCLSLGFYLLLNRPKRVFCGHINLAPLVQWLCQPLGIPYIILTYGKEVWEPLPPPYQQALQQAASIWTISRYSRDRACASNQLDPQKFKMLPCAVNCEVFSPGPKPSDLISRYHLADSKVLMTVARLWPGDIYKGVDVTIRALPRISQIIPNVKYLVIGRGDDQPRLAQLATDMGVSDRVVFAGFVPTADLPAHYRVADAYVMPSREGFGIVYLEAMASGVPVVAGNDDGSADPLQDGKVGWQVPHRDPEAVAAACIEILQGKDPRCQSAWLREQTQAMFGTDAFTDRLEQLLMFQE
jgi:phosphatidylinositol alpha-1,6-mannosyltransferase